MTSEDLRVFLKFAIQRAEDNAQNSCRGLGHNSYGAGYDSGYLDALRRVREEITQQHVLPNNAGEGEI